MNFEGFDYGIVSFSDYQKHRPVKNKDWIRSIIVFIFPYAGKKPDVDGYLTAKFAYGQDYHVVIKNKLERFAKGMGLEKYETYTDISFLDEKLCAVLAGLGKIGKNNLLLTPRYGSRVLIGEIVTDSVFPKTERELPNPCLDCQLCVKNCPTGALRDGFNKKICLSYLSQTKGDAYELYDKMEFAVGCDICQDVCPLNKKEAVYPAEFSFDSKSRFVLKDFLKLDDNSFREYYQNKTFAFLGYTKILRNLLVLEAKNKQITASELEEYEKLSDEEWFKKHIEYLKGRITSGKS